MASKSPWRITWYRAIIAGWMAVTCAGCGGGMDLGPSIRVPAEQHQVVEASAAGKEVSLPKDQAFNIHVKQSTQNPGANGAAQGTADATGSGEASCSAVVSDGGAATGKFQIGQMIDYRGDAPMKASVKMTFKLAQELGAEPIAAGTVAQLSLAASVRDSAGRVNPKIAIESLSSDDAPGKADRSDAREFSFVMEQGGSYQIVLDGSVNATSEGKGKAIAKISIRDLQMAISFSPAPPPATAPASAAK